MDNWIEADRKEALAALYAQRDRYDSMVTEYLTTLHEVGQGTCMDCHEQAELLEYYRVEVCWPCAARRARTAARLATEDSPAA